jgi:methanogenic corrinoid protein MtbC1
VEYLYLVKSEWDKVKKTSKQKTIKYLGDSSTVNRDDIPVEYRNDPKINAYLIENTPKDFKRRQAIINKFQAQFFSSLTEGVLKDSIQLYESFVGQSTIEKFYEKIMNPVMAKIGDMWSVGKLSIATEHVASNVAQSLVKIISDNHKKNKLDKGKVIITTPVGEDHCISCNVLESLLLSKGFTTFNISPSTPAESLIQFVKTVRPTAILISITLDDNIKSGQRLAKKIHDAYKKLPIFVGGQAFLNNTRSKFDATLIENTRQLDQIPRILTKKQ